MRAVRYFNHGDPSIVLSEIRLPEPEAPCFGHVLIKVTKRPIRLGDLHCVRGRYRASSDPVPSASCGVTPGSEGVGRIVSVGPGACSVRGLRIGQRVGFFPAAGGWSEFVQTRESYVVPIPDDIPDELASQLFVNPMTAIMLMRSVTDAGLGMGEPAALLVNAAGSNVARIVALLAQMRDIAVVGIVRRDAAIDELSARLPEARIVSTESANWMRQARSAAAGRPFRAALDPVGGRQANDILALLADGGVYVSYGNLSGEPTPLNSLTIPTRDLTLRGVSVRRWASLPEPQRAEDVRTAFQLMRDAPHQFEIVQDFPFARISEAVSLAESRWRRGTVLLSS
jgi:NADPH:quinone reductase-like Zn-dependent oxidoreductase